MHRRLVAYETDDPDPAGRRVRRDITAHAYDERKQEPVHQIRNTYQNTEAQWIGWAEGAIICPRCATFMSSQDIDELA